MSALLGSKKMSSINSKRFNFSAVVPSTDDLPQVVNVLDQPCQQLYEANPVLLGYDVVEYHFIPAFRDGGVAVSGDPRFAYNFNGYQFWFKDEYNRELFVEDPWKYAPAWGGFCSWGIALENPPRWPWKLEHLGPPASPWEGWLIVDGVLMFNIWASYSDRFMKDAENNVRLAAQRWKNWFGDVHAGPFNTHCIGHGELKNWCLSPQPSPWTEELPECVVEAVEPELVPDSDNNETIPTIKVSGGGIVSTTSNYEDFSNDSLTSHQKTMIISFSVLGVVLALLVGVFIYFSCYKKKKNGNNTNEIQSKDIEVAVYDQDMVADFNTSQKDVKNSAKSDTSEES